MKFTILLTLLATLNVSASLYSQDTKLNLSVKDKTLKEVIKLIENQSNFRFFFSDDYLDLNKKVTLSAQDKSINEVLTNLLVDGTVTYKVLENNVVVITPTSAQQTKVTGTITDATSGEVIPGVNVLVKGTTRGVTSDMDGKYSIEVNANDVLVFTYMGYLPEEITFAGQSVLNMVLVPDVKKLDEVVVVGYGTMKKRDLTGSVSSIKSDDIRKTASSNAMQSMQARMPGLDIQQNSGEAGSKLNISLRGKRSIIANNDPLILVDGIEYGSTLDLNPSDIESIDVLKDASSTAIYGTKGANGVIIITTKRGKAGKTVVNFNAFVSSNQPTNIPRVMYGENEVKMMIDKANYKADLASGNWGASNIQPEGVLTLSLADGTTQLSIYQDGSYTDWADIILQNGLTQNYELSVAGGNENTMVNLSLGTMFEEGLMKNDQLDRYNGRMNIDHKFSKLFKVGGSVLFTYKNHDARNSSVYTQSMKMTTITHPYLTDGSLNATPNPNYAAHCNPLLDEVDGAYQKNIETGRLFGNTYLEINPFKNIIFKSMFALDRTNVRTGIYEDYESVARYQSPKTSSISSESEYTTKFTWDNTLNYNTTFGGTKHEVSALLGQSTTQNVYEETLTSGACGQAHFYKSTFYDLKNILTPKSTSKYTKSAMLSYFGRVNYKFNEKYLFTASLRADGSSTLSEGHKWGYFPSVAGAWRMNEESFLSNTKSWLSNLKLRASWGISGNAAVNPYSTLKSLSTDMVYYYLNGTDLAGNVPSNLGNPNLTWEKTAAYDFGIDFGVLDNRINGSVDYYISHTSDLLMYKTAPASSVYASVISNIGETEGHGIEVSLNTLLVKSRDFSYDVNWSYTSARDKITYLFEGVDKTINGNDAYIVGKPVSTFYDYEANGCWGVGEFAKYKTDWEARHSGQTLNYGNVEYGVVGTIKVKDQDDNGKLDNNDKIAYDRSPKHIFGMNNTFTYKNLSLAVLVYARLGGYLEYNMNSQLNFESANWGGDIDYWTYANQGGKFPNPGTKSAIWGSYGSSLLYEKADYIKIKDITLSYNLPTNLLNKVGVEQVKIYGSLKNYFTFSKIDNYDSERGGDISFPLAKQMVFGLNVQF